MSLTNLILALPGYELYHIHWWQYMTTYGNEVTCHMIFRCSRMNRFIPNNIISIILAVEASQQNSSNWDLFTILFINGMILQTSLSLKWWENIWWSLWSMFTQLHYRRKIKGDIWVNRLARTILSFACRLMSDIYLLLSVILCYSSTC